MRSNRTLRTLAAPGFCVTAPEPGVPEAALGAVVTALDEAAVVCAAIGNTGVINVVGTHEALAVKMLGALRQEIVRTEHLEAAGREPGWLLTAGLGLLPLAVVELYKVAGRPWRRYGPAPG
ncbi:MAG TPA: hypothetical protein VNM66_00410 [Thermodesulfobacteriota bacterium]|nr:hypothetical protein [Thermodesulfobacteriota bacterium]